MRKQESGVRREENVKGTSGDRADRKKVMERIDFWRRNLKKEVSRNEPRKSWVVLDGKER